MAQHPVATGMVIELLGFSPGWCKDFLCGEAYCSRASRVGQEQRGDETPSAPLC